MRDYARAYALTQLIWSAKVLIFFDMSKFFAQKRQKNAHFLAFFDFLQ